MTEDRYILKKALQEQQQNGFMNVPVLFVIISWLIFADSAASQNYFNSLIPETIFRF